MSNITFGGFATGLDTNAIIDAFVKAERIPQDAVLKQKAAVDAASQTISGLSSKLFTLREAAAALSDPKQFASTIATSSDSSIVASAGTGAAAGRYEVQVTQLAKEQRTYGDAQSSGTTALGQSGTLSLTVGTGTPIDITIDAGDSLSAIASKINSTGARVSANVLFDGTNYRLAVRGLDSGSANTFSFTETGITLGMTNPANPKQDAQDAIMLVDNITVRRSSNQVTGLISGVTLALTKTTTTPTVINVASDGTLIKSKIQAFVNAYNDVMQSGQAATGYGAQKAANAELAADPTVRGMMDRLSRLMSAPITATTGKYTSLMSVGLSSTKDGTLRFDGTTFDTALQADPTAVARLFTKDTSLGSTGAFDAFKRTIDSLNSGQTAPMIARVTSLQKQSVRLQDSADAMERRITAYQDALRKQFSDLETIVSKYKSQGSSIGASSSGSGTSSTG